MVEMDVLVVVSLNGMCGDMLGLLTLASLTSELDISVRCRTMAFFYDSLMVNTRRAKLGLLK